MKQILATALIGFLAVSLVSSAEKPKPGIDGKTAPAWKATDWIQLPKGKQALELADFKGKTVYLYCFQSWCPGCHSVGFPTLQKLVKEHTDNDAIAFVAIQTVFEGHSQNTPKKLKSMADRYKLKIPFGHSGSEEKRSELMHSYRTAGTPWTIIIDPKGKVRFNDFHITVEKANALFEEIGKN